MTTPLHFKSNLCFGMFLYRFIRLPIILSNSRPPAGPASRTYYSLPAHLIALYPGANHLPELRAELSLAYSRVHLLLPHAVVLSYLEQMPLSHYVDHDAIRSASQLYPPLQTPINDLRRSQAEVANLRRRSLRDQSRQIRRLHTPSST